MAETRVLKGGPQDGGKVHKSGDGLTLPDTLYVGAVPMGDMYAAWNDTPYNRKPAEYVRDGEVFTFTRYCHAGRD